MGMASKSVNDRTRLAIIGPAVKTPKPTIQGSRSAYPHHASARPSAPPRVRGGAPAAFMGRVRVEGERWLLAGRVEGGLRLGVRVAQGLGRIGPTRHDRVHGGSPGLL